MSQNGLSAEICENKSMQMCPVCDNCGYADVKTNCNESRWVHVFDNDATVAFAVVISLWAAAFMEYWKKYSKELTHRWHVNDYTPEAEHPRPQYLQKLNTVKEKTVNFITNDRITHFIFFPLKRHTFSIT